MNRKEFIKNMSIALAGCLFMPQKLFAYNTPATNDNAVWAGLIDYARWSPSPHNIQPWQVKVISSLEAELYCDPARLIPVSDKNNKFMLVAFGVFIEYLSVAALQVGYKLTFTGNNEFLDAGTAGNHCVGKLVLTKSDGNYTYDRELIKQRKTSRLTYRPEQVNAATLSALETIATTYGCSFNYITNEQKVNAILRLDRDTLFSDLNNDPIRNELNNWLRFSEKEAKEKNDGLWSHCMRFPGKLMRSFFHNHNVYDHGLVKKIINRYYLRSMDGTKTIAWFRGKTNSATDCINAGKMLATTWLELTKNKAFMHPFGSLITNPEAHSKLKKIIDQPGNDDEIWFVARLGYSHEPPRSYRLSTNDILI